MSNNYVPIYNFTNLFHRDILLYAIGDWRLGAPLSMRRVGYTAFFAAIWIVPIVYIFGFHMNPYFLFLLALPPFYLGGAASKPILKSFYPIKASEAYLHGFTLFAPIFSY